MASLGENRLNSLNGSPPPPPPPHYHYPPSRSPHQEVRLERDKLLRVQQEYEAQLRAKDQDIEAISLSHHKNMLKLRALHTHAQELWSSEKHILLDKLKKVERDQERVLRDSCNRYEEAFQEAQRCYEEQIVRLHETSNAQINDLQSSNEALRLENQKYREQVKSCEQRIQELAIENKTLNKDLKNAQEALTKKAKASQILKVQETQRVAACDSLKSDLKKEHQELLAFKQKELELQKQQEHLSKQVSLLKSKCSDLTVEMSNSTAKCTSLASEYEKLKEENSSLLRLNVDLRSQLGNLHSSVWEAARAENTTLIQSFKFEISNLKLQMAKMAANHESYLKTAHQSEHEAEAKIDLLTSSHEALETELRLAHEKEKALLIKQHTLAQQYISDQVGALNEKNSLLENKLEHIQIESRRGAEMNSILNVDLEQTRALVEDLMQKNSDLKSLLDESSAENIALRSHLADLSHLQSRSAVEIANKNIPPLNVSKPLDLPDDERQRLVEEIKSLKIELESEKERSLKKYSTQLQAIETDFETKTTKLFSLQKFSSAEKDNEILTLKNRLETLSNALHSLESHSAAEKTELCKAYTQQVDSLKEKFEEYRKIHEAEMIRLKQSEQFLSALLREQEMEFQACTCSMRIAHEEALKGFLPLEVKNELEATIAALKEQIYYLRMTHES